MYGKPEITEHNIKCEECGKYFKKINSPHLLKMHNITIDEYKELWGLCKTQPLEAFYIKKIRQYNAKIYNSVKNIKPFLKKNAFKKGHISNFDRREQHTLNSRANGAFMIKHTTASKKKIGEASKKLWQNKKYREKSIATYKKIYNTPEMRKEMGKRSLKGWSDPEVCKKSQQQKKKFWNSPKGKAMASARAKKMWKNPKIRAKIIKTRRAQTKKLT